MDRPRLEAFTASGSQSQAASAMDLSKVDSLLVSVQRNIETGFKFLLKTQIGKKNQKQLAKNHPKTIANRGWDWAGGRWGAGGEPFGLPRPSGTEKSQMTKK